jgi:hypothetical protein
MVSPELLKQLGMVSPELHIGCVVSPELMTEVESIGFQGT